MLFVADTMMIFCICIYSSAMLLAPPPLLGESSFFADGLCQNSGSLISLLVLPFGVPEVRVELVPFRPSGPPRLIRFLDPAIPSSLFREFPLHPSFRMGSWRM